MGRDGKIKPFDPDLKILNQGETLSFAGDAELTLEDGTLLRLANSLPPDVPLGYHTLRLLSSEAAARLIVAPPKCFFRENFRAWGWRSSYIRCAPPKAGAWVISPISAPFASGPRTNTVLESS